MLLFCLPLCVYKKGNSQSSFDNLALRRICKTKYELYIYWNSGDWLTPDTSLTLCLSRIRPVLCLCYHGWCEAQRWHQGPERFYLFVTNMRHLNSLFVGLSYRAGSERSKRVLYKMIPKFVKCDLQLWMMPVTPVIHFLSAVVCQQKQLHWSIFTPFLS